VCSALLNDKRGDSLVQEVQRWLDVFRFEFALPERHELGGLVEKNLLRLRELEVMQGDAIDSTHPVVIATIGALDVFREAYWLGTKTVQEHLAVDGTNEKALVVEYQKAYDAALLVGEATQPEGATTVLFQNVTSRLVELGYIRMERRGRGGRERVYLPGPRRTEIEQYGTELRDALIKGRSVWPRPL
jgi:hypothetical protein